MSKANKSNDNKSKDYPTLVNPATTPVLNPHTGETLLVYPPFAPGIERRLREGWTPAAIAELKAQLNWEPFVIELGRLINQCQSPASCQEKGADNQADNAAT